MLCLIAILGGLLIMMGQHSRSEALFYYFRLEDQVPETHLLRLIDKHISFAFVREKMKPKWTDQQFAKGIRERFSEQPNNRAVFPFVGKGRSHH
jgi:hypothetical protein